MMTEFPGGTIGLMDGLDQVHTPFMQSLTDLLTHTQAAIDCDLTVIHTGTTEHASARASLVDNMVGEWLLMLDTDHFVERDALHRLLLTMYGNGPENVPVVTGLYFARHHYSVDAAGARRYAQLYVDSPEDHQAFRAYDYAQAVALGHHDRQTPFWVSACGGGILLVHRMAFDRIAQTGERPFDNRYLRDGRRVGEDLSFCLRCRELGIPILCQPQAQSYHVEQRLVTLDDAILEAQERLAVEEAITCSSERGSG